MRIPLDPNKQYRWSIRYEPFPRKEKLRPRHLMRRLKRVAVPVLGTTLVIAFQSIATFALLMMIGSWFDHKGMVWAVITAVGLEGIVLLMSLIASLSGKGERHDGVAGISYLVAICLPLLMYITAVPQGYVAFEIGGGANPELWDWIQFYAYMFLDTIFLGVPQVLIGEVSSLQSASLASAVLTFVIRLLMTIGVVGAIVRYATELFSGGYEVSGKLEDLKKALEAEQAVKRKVWVYTLATEEPFRGANVRMSAAEVLEEYGPSEEMLRYREAGGNHPALGSRIMPRHYLIVSYFIVGGMLLYSFLQWIWPFEPDYGGWTGTVLKWLGAVTGGFFGLVFALLFAAMFAKHLKTLKRARRGKKCRVSSDQ